MAQQCRRTGADLVGAIVTAYEVQVALTRAIDLHRHRIDHVAHLGPSVAAWLGTLLGLPVEVTYQAINQALHVTTTTRQSRKGSISSWKAFAPAHAGKLAVEAVDRAMQGQGSPAPIREGEDGDLDRLSQVQVLLAIRERTRLDRRLLDRLPRLELVLQPGGHAYHVDEETATGRGIVVALGRRWLAGGHGRHPGRADLGVLGLGRHGRPLAADRPQRGPHPAHRLEGGRGVRRWAEIATEPLPAWLAGRLPAGEVLNPAAAQVPRDRLGGLASG